MGGNTNTKYTEVLMYHMDDVIFREGDPGGNMYMVESGCVGIVKQYGTPQSKLLAKMKAGDFFGEMGMVRGYPRSASAVVLEPDTGIVPITWDTLGSFFVTSPSKIVMLMQQLSNSIANTTDMYLDACKAVTELVDLAAELKEKSAALEAMLPDQVTEIKPLTGIYKRLINDEIAQCRQQYKSFTDSYYNAHSRFARR